MYSNVACGAPADPLAAAPAILSSCRNELRYFLRQISRSGLGECIDNAVDHLLDQPLVVALTHYPDDRFGPRGADDQPALAVEALLGVLDRGADFCVFERLAALV